MNKIGELLGEVDGRFAKLDEGKRELQDLNWMRSRHINILSDVVAKVSILLDEYPEEEWRDQLTKFLVKCEEDLDYCNKQVDNKENDE